MSRRPSESSVDDSSRAHLTTIISDTLPVEMWRKKSTGRCIRREGDAG